MTRTVEIQHDLRSTLGPVRDQGQRPTCLAFAASDAHAQARGKRVALSCEFAFYHAQRRSGRTATQGATLPHMLNALREDGQPVEAGWPYLVSLPLDLAEWRPPAGATPLFGRRASAIPVSVAGISPGSRPAGPSSHCSGCRTASSHPTWMAWSTQSLASRSTRQSGTLSWWWPKGTSGGVRRCSCAIAGGQLGGKPVTPGLPKNTWGRGCLARRF